MWYNLRTSVAPRIISEKERYIHPRTEYHMSASVHLKDDLNKDRLFLSVADSTVTLHSFANEELLLNYALDALLDATNASAGSIFIWDEGLKELVLRAARGPCPYLERLAGARVKLREGISGWVADRGSSILVKNIEEDRRFLDVKRAGEYQSLSFISIPILSGNKLVGVINVTERKDLGQFSEDDFERVNILAGHVAIACENLKTRKRLDKDNEILHEKVSDLKKSMRQQEALVSIGKLASHLAHELNNPLDGIRRFVNLSLDQVKEETLAREYLLKAKGGIRRAIGIIRGLLAFSSQTAKQNGKVSDIHKLVDQCVQCAQKETAFGGIGFETQLCEGTFFVLDRGLMTVFQNLFDNARHAMKDTGKITVRTEIQNERIVIHVSDTGPGIPAHVKNRIFEPFFTTKDNERGTGIGLAICKDIVERAGGEIRFTTEDGRGTTFMIYLPFKREAEQLS